MPPENAFFAPGGGRVRWVGCYKKWLLVMIRRPQAALGHHQPSCSNGWKSGWDGGHRLSEGRWCKNGAAPEDKLETGQGLNDTQVIDYTRRSEATLEF